MIVRSCAALIALGAMVLAPSLARSEMLAMMNYETKSKEFAEIAEGAGAAR